ncbi:gluzincin family metallopeptidase [Haloplasma contractile]|uniref:Peptidase domain containing protein n=1 Tax=Haloplasma contractile SSD-17B TaxID=1033810 RepID=U2DSY5_9MOLU|nr:M3 family metallopeptidase [Haloplasma contractile]ERJ11607.1 Peptidase domain containing protein [Haloplasma contractile SSD-17B]
MNTINQVEKIYDELHELSVNYSKLNWTLYTTGYDFGCTEAFQRINEVLKNKDYFVTIRDLRNQPLNGVDKRKIEIIYNMFKNYHLSDELNDLNLKIQKKVNELSKVLNTFRYTFEGKKVSSVFLKQVMSSDSSRERRKEAYLTMNQINEPMIEAGFIDLLKLRKKFANKYGANDFVAYKLEENELDQDLFDDWLKQLHDLLPKMNETRTMYAKEYLDDDVIRPWDEAYISSQIAPSLNKQVDMSDYYEQIQSLFHVFGIDISEFNITYDIFPRANKSEWGYNFPVETAKDSRIIANVKNKFYEYGVLLHETGHAVHSFLLKPENGLLNRGVSGIISEGIANLFQSFLYSNLFYGAFFDDQKEVEEEFSKLKAYKKLNALRSINRIFFDHELYRSDIETLDDVYALYHRVHKEVLCEESPVTNPPWAFLIHHTTHPIYLHNYFMGDVTCEMLFKVFEERSGTKCTENPKEFSDFLKAEVIEPTGLYRYNDLFKRISGNDFSLAYLLSDEE